MSDGVDRVCCTVYAYWSGTGNWSDFLINNESKTANCVQADSFLTITDGTRAMTTALADFSCVSGIGIFPSFFFRGCLGSKRKWVRVNLILTIDPSISTLYSTLHVVPKHLIFMTRAPQTF